MSSDGNYDSSVDFEDQDLKNFHKSKPKPYQQQQIKQHSESFNASDRKNDDDSDQEQQEQKQYSQESIPSMNPQNKLEQQLLKIASSKQKHTPLQQRIIEQIQTKLEDLNRGANSFLKKHNKLTNKMNLLKNNSQLLNSNVWVEKPKQGNKSRVKKLQPTFKNIEKLNLQDLITIRIQELVLNKLLVNSYGKMEIRVIISQYHLGEVYLLNDCLEQAVEHITQSLQKNQKIISLTVQELAKGDQAQYLQLSKYCSLHSYMQNTLAQCYIKLQQFDEATQLLQLSIHKQTNPYANKLSRISSMSSKIQDIQLFQDQFSPQFLIYIESLHLLAQCYQNSKDVQSATQTIEIVIKNLERKLDKADVEDLNQDDQITLLLEYQQLAFSYNLKAKIYEYKNQIEQAIKAQNSAIETLIKINYSQPQQVAQMYNQLSILEEKIGKVSQALQSIKKVKKLYDELLKEDLQKSKLLNKSQYSEKELDIMNEIRVSSVYEKKLIKTKRKIATLLLKTEKFQQAIRQLSEIFEMQEKIYGEKSIQVARTMKLLGIVYASYETSEAKTYLKQAMQIFVAHGNKKQVHEIKQKIKLIGSNPGVHGGLDINVINEEDG